MTIGLRIGARIGVGPGIRVGSGFGNTSSTTLTVVLADSLDPVITSVNYNYTIVVENVGSIGATTVTAVLTLDPQSTYVSGSGTGWAVSESAGVVTCSRAALAVGVAPTITITVTSSATAETSSATVVANATNATGSVNDTETTVVNLVSKDATSGILVPNSSTEWTNFVAYHVALGTTNFPNIAPGFLWLCQEASSNLSDSIGGVTLTANNTPLYQQTVTGWTRKAVGTADGTSGQRFASTSASLPDLSVTSALLISYIAITATPGGVRGVTEMGTTVTEARVTTTPAARLISGANTATGANTLNTGVKPWSNRFNQTADTNSLFTDTEKITPTFGATVTGKSLKLGATAGAAPSAARYLYAVLFTSTNAEISDAQLKALLQALGWTITF